MSAAWYAKFAMMNRIRPTAGATSAMKNVLPMHSSVKASRNGMRRPPRSEMAPRNGEIAAFKPTLATMASENSRFPSRSPN